MRKWTGEGGRVGGSRSQTLGVGWPRGLYPQKQLPMSTGRRPFNIIEAIKKGALNACPILESITVAAVNQCVALGHHGCESKRHGRYQQFSTEQFAKLQDTAVSLSRMPTTELLSKIGFGRPKHTFDSAAGTDHCGNHLTVGMHARLREHEVRMRRESVDSALPGGLMLLGGSIDDTVLWRKHDLQRMKGQSTPVITGECWTLQAETNRCIIQPPLNPADAVPGCDDKNLATLVLTLNSKRCDWWPQVFVFVRTIIHKASHNRPALLGCRLSLRQPWPCRGPQVDHDRPWATLAEEPSHDLLHQKPGTAIDQRPTNDQALAP